MEAIKVYTLEEDFSEYVESLSANEPLEIDAEMFNYWLGVLPPVRNNAPDRMLMIGMGGQYHPIRGGDTFQRFDFAFAEGVEPVTIFWSKGGRYFAMLTEVINHG